jgi:hypothetical protein
MCPQAQPAVPATTVTIALLLPLSHVLHPALYLWKVETQSLHQGFSRPVCYMWVAVGVESLQQLEPHRLITRILQHIMAPAAACQL